MSKPIHALDYLDKPAKYSASAVCVVFGDEMFLKTQVLRLLRKHVLGQDEGDFSLTTLAGNVAQSRDVFDELSTIAMFGGRRMVLIDDADDFVSNNRQLLEDYVEQSKGSGVLVLDVKTWASNTRLAKRLTDADGLQVECKPPAPARLVKWLVSRAASAHGAKLDNAAAEVLIDLVEPDLGLIDQELARIALLAGPQGTITPALVSENVGGWRVKKTWDMIDAAVEGNAREALLQLDRLLLAGENAIGLLAQIASTLRRFASAARLVDRHQRAGRRVALRSILETVGFKPFVLDKAERQLKQIGRVRAGRLHRWLLEADLALKGASSSPPRARLVLEQLVVRLSTVAAPQPRPAR